MTQCGQRKAVAYLTQRLTTKKFDYPHTFKSRNECKELSIFNVDALRR